MGHNFITIYFFLFIYLSACRSAKRVAYLHTAASLSSLFLITLKNIQISFAIFKNF